MRASSGSETAGLVAVIQSSSIEPCSAYRKICIACVGGAQCGIVVGVDVPQLGELARCAPGSPSCGSRAGRRRRRLARVLRGRLAVHLAARRRRAGRACPRRRWRLLTWHGGRGRLVGLVEALQHGGQQPLGRPEQLRRALRSRAAGTSQISATRVRRVRRRRLARAPRTRWCARSTYASSIQPRCDAARAGGRSSAPGWCRRGGEVDVGLAGDRGRARVDARARGGSGRGGGRASASTARSASRRRCGRRARSRRSGRRRCTSRAGRRSRSSPSAPRPPSPCTAGCCRPGAACRCPALPMTRERVVLLEEQLAGGVEAEPSPAARPVEQLPGTRDDPLHRGVPVGLDEPPAVADQRPRAAGPARCWPASRRDPWDRAGHGSPGRPARPRTPTIRPSLDRDVHGRRRWSAAATPICTQRSTSSSASPSARWVSTRTGHGSPAPVRRALAPRVGDAVGHDAPLPTTASRTPGGDPVNHPVGGTRFDPTEGGNRRRQGAVRRAAATASQRMEVDNMSAEPTGRPFAVVTGASSGIGFERPGSSPSTATTCRCRRGLRASTTPPPSCAATAAHGAGVQVDLATTTAWSSSIGRSTAPAGRWTRSRSTPGAAPAATSPAAPTCATSSTSSTSTSPRPCTWPSGSCPPWCDRGAGKVLFTSSIASTMPGIVPGGLQRVEGVRAVVRRGDPQRAQGHRRDRHRADAGPTDTNFFERADMQDTKVGAGEKDDPAQVAAQGFEALMNGDDHVVAGARKNKLQAAAAQGRCRTR